jgi:hypothetical protein
MLPERKLSWESGYTPGRKDSEEIKSAYACENGLNGTQIRTVEIICHQRKFVKNELR